MMDKLVVDDIPNIRFNVAKSYGVLIDVLKQLPPEGTISMLEKAGRQKTGSPKGQELIRSSILPNLEKLAQDSDVDVIYFANAASAKANEGDA